MKLSRNARIAIAVLCVVVSVIGFMLKLPRAFRGHDKEMHAGFYFAAAAFFNFLFAGKNWVRHAIIFAGLFAFSVAIEHAQEYSNKWLGRTIHGRYDPEDVRYNLKGLLYFSGVWLVWWVFTKLFNKD